MPVSDALGGQSLELEVQGHQVANVRLVLDDEHQARFRRAIHLWLSLAEPDPAERRCHGFFTFVPRLCLVVPVEWSSRTLTQGTVNSQ